MKNLIAVFIVLLNLSIVAHLEANPINPKPASKVSFTMVDQFVTINYLAGVDLNERRSITILDENNKCIFKCKTRKREKISEINMNQLKVGTYKIQTKVGDEVYVKTFHKD